MNRLMTAALISALIFVSCSTQQIAPDNGSEAAFLVAKPETGKAAATQLFIDESADWTWDLIAGQHYLAGTVYVHNDEENMYFTFHTFEDWPMHSAHVYCGNEEPAKGAPGQFPEGMEFDPPVFDYTFTVPLGAMAFKSLVYIAAHADVGNDENSETAWGGYWNDGDPYWDFEWKKWGGGFTTNVMPMPELPDYWVTYKGSHYGTYSYWNVMFQDSFTMPPGSLGDNFGPWVGWCADKDHTMYANSPYEVMLYSSYDTALPPMAQGIEWDMLNYMLTQRRNNGSGIWNQTWTGTAAKDQFQNAFWYFTDGIVPAAGSLAEQFVDDAIANGDGFIPGSGDYYAVILYPDTSTNNNVLRAQMNIIEVDP